MVVAQVAFTVAFPYAFVLVRKNVDAIRSLAAHARIPTNEYLTFVLEMDDEADRSVAADMSRDAYLVRFDAAYQELERRLEADPRVTAVTLGTSLPALDHTQRRFEIEEVASGTGLVSSSSVALDFFETMGSPVLAGRGFDSRDLFSSAPVVVVNRSFIAIALGGQQPIGRRVRYVNPRSGPGSDDEPWHEIVGVGS